MKNLILASMAMLCIMSCRKQDHHPQQTSNPAAPLGSKEASASTQSGDSTSISHPIQDTLVSVPHIPHDSTGHGPSDTLSISHGQDTIVVHPNDSISYRQIKH